MQKGTKNETIAFTDDELRAADASLTARGIGACLCRFLCLCLCRFLCLCIHVCSRDWCVTVPFLVRVLCLQCSISAGLNLFGHFHFLTRCKWHSLQMRATASLQIWAFVCVRSTACDCDDIVTILCCMCTCGYAFMQGVLSDWTTSGCFYLPWIGGGARRSGRRKASNTMTFTSHYPTPTKTFTAFQRVTLP